MATSSEHPAAKPAEILGGAPAAPYARAVQVTAGACLAVAGILNGLPQYITYLYGSPAGANFSPYLEWTLANPSLARGVHAATLVSMLPVTFGILAIAHVCRWRAPRLTILGTPLALWGMWGFHSILTVGFLLNAMMRQSPDTTRAFAQSVDAAVPFDAFLVALLPHMVGSFLGMVLLSLAWLKSGFAKAPAILILVFLVWDFLLRPIGILEPHAVLVVAWVWMGVYLARMPTDVWQGTDPRTKSSAPAPTAAGAVEASP